MIRKILLSVGLMTAGLCFAAPLTPDQALSRVDRTDILGVGTRAAQAVPAMVLNTQVGEPALYVFKGSEAKGFMVVSADDAVTPLLGYSDNDSFELENISPAMREWLDQYAAQIEFARQQGYEPSTRVALPAWSPVEPMVKTKWNQSTPYNEMCPMQGNVRCYTGCVATSMAQVMKYFNYPDKGAGNISYKCETLNGVRLTLDFSTLTFDWNNMIDTYSRGDYSKAQADAVAALMMAAGYSVEMGYTANVSGALSGKIPGALVRNFGYDKSIRYHSRAPYTYTEWATMIYNNLKNVGPIIYDGNSIKSGGHSFVCDGYRGEGYFHFNWGWGGSGDGYYVLDALSPTSLGIGAGGGGFNFSQDAVFNITPNKGSGDEVAENQIVIYGSVEGIFVDNKLNINLQGGEVLGWSYQGLSSMTIDLGAKLVPVNNPNATPVYVVSENGYNLNQELEPGEYMPPTTRDNYNREVNLRPYFTLSTLPVEKGVQYKVTNVYRPVNGDWEEVIVDSGSFNYFYLTKTGDTNVPASFELKNFYPLELTCNSLTLDSDLYNGIAATISATVTNDTDLELTRGISFALVDENGKLMFRGDTKVVSLSPGEKQTYQITDILTAQNSSVVVSRPTQFYMGLYDEETATLYYKSTETVTMQPNPGRPYFSSEITIDNAKWTGGRYVVDDSSNMQVTTTITVTRNIFSYPMVINVLQSQGTNANGSTTYTILLKYPYDIAVLKNGESKAFTADLNFNGAIVGNTYYLGLIVNNESSLTGQTIPFYVAGTGAGVDDLVSDGAEVDLFYDRSSSKVIATGNVARVEVFSLNGVKLAETAGSGAETVMDVSSLGKGIVLVSATDTQGQRKTIKLAL